MNEQSTLQSEAPIANHITCVAVDVSKNGFILSADLMRSISGRCHSNPIFLLTFCFSFFLQAS
jgi:hypothetical protein